MAKWKVNEGRQVNLNGIVYEAGDTFEASDEAAAPLAAWITKTKAASAEGKAQKSSANKAVKSSANKSAK